MSLPLHSKKVIQLIWFFVIRCAFVCQVNYLKLMNGFSEIWGAFLLWY